MIPLLIIEFAVPITKRIKSNICGFLWWICCRLAIGSSPQKIGNNLIVTVDNLIIDFRFTIFVQIDRKGFKQYAHSTTVCWLHPPSKWWSSSNNLRSAEIMMWTKLNFLKVWKITVEENLNNFRKKQLIKSILKFT